MLTKKDQIQLDHYDEALSGYFNAVTPVILAFLFGSHVRKQAGPLSDIDVAILLDDSLTPPERFDLRLRVIGDLIDLLQTNEVDVTVLNEISLPLQYRVLRDGVLLYCRNEDTRVQFTAQTVDLFHDKPSSAKMTA